MALVTNRVVMDSVMRSYNEYLFARAVQYANEKQDAAGEPHIKKRQAIQLREGLSFGPNVTIGSASKKQAMAAFSDAFGKAGVQLFADKAEEDRFYMDSLSRFSSITGITSKMNVQTKKMDGAYLPMSPYDPRYCLRQTFLDNGNQILYAKAENINQPNGVQKDAELVQELNRRDFPLYKAVPNPDGTSRMTVAGQSHTAGDASGFSALSTLVSEKNAAEVRAWVEAGSSKRQADGSMSGPIYASEKQVKQAYDVFSQLKEEGYSFFFRRDDQPGQLKAKFDTPDGKRFEARVLDPLHPEYGAGARFYLDGAAGYYSTDKNVTLPDGKMVHESYYPNTQECVDLIKYGLGDSMTRSDGKPVGAPTARSWHSKTKGDYTSYDSYYAGKTLNAVVKNLPNSRYNKVVLRVTSNRSEDSRYFPSASDANNFLRESVDSARENFANAMDVERLIAERNEHADDAEYVPAFSDDPDISAMQERYWDVLSDKGAQLLKPGVDADEYYADMDDLYSAGLSGTAVEAFAKQSMVYSGSPEEQVRQHFSDLTNYTVGTFAPDSEGKRFNPVGVSRYMTSAYGMYRNSDDLLSAMRKADVKASELKGDDYYNRTIEDKLLKFDEASAVPMKDKKSPFMQAMYQTVASSIRENACEVEDDNIRIDKNGIVQYAATKIRSRPGTKRGQVTGVIGQIFEPDERGVVTTRFAGSENYSFVPGMTARVVPNRDGENLPYEERMRVSTYQDDLAKSIRYAIRADLLDNTGEVGDVTRLSSVVRHNQGVRFTEEELSSKPKELQDAMLAAERGRIVFDDVIKDGAGRFDLYKAANDPNRDPDDNMHMDAVSLMDGENYAILRPKESAGRLDARATGTGPAQGCRYLVEGASIAPDGSIEPARLPDGSVNTNAKNGISAYIDEREGEYDAVDRFDMTVTALRHCKDVRPANVAQVTFGGWGHGDAVVMSKHWAEENGIHDIGDKVSDFHGNKGVVSLIVDPDMDPEEAEKQHLTEAVAWFKKNPDLDMVMSPYSAVSRFNAGLYREAMKGETKDLTAPDGTVYPGTIGKLDIIIMEQTAAKKTTNYLDEEAAQESGRNFGGQTGWSLGSNGALATLQSGFSRNTRSVVNLREMLIATGMDISETGQLRVGYEPHEGEERPVFEMEQLEYVAKGKSGKQEIDFAKMKKKLGLSMEASGGMLEMPFPLKFPAGKAKDAEGHFVDMGSTPKRDPAERSEASKAAYDGDTYLVPVLSAHLRTGADFDDGTRKDHDYTNQYLRLYEAGLKWRDAKENGASASVLAAYERQGQAEYNKITDELISSRFTGKRNVMRTTILGAKQHAMTAVVTPDPRLDLEQVSMNPQMAEALHVKEGQKVLTWRDPLLTKTGMSSVAVKFDPNQRCMGVSPFTGEGKDRDHDGDTEGIRAFDTAASREEADTVLNIRGRLLNTAVKPENGDYPLAVDTGEDAAAGLVANPALKDVRDELTVRVNGFERAGRDGQITPKELEKNRKTALSDLNKYVHAVQDASYGVHVIRYDSPENCFASIEQYVKDGCKGSPKKLDTFGRYLGVSYDRDANGEIDYSTFVDHGQCMASEKERTEPLAARNMQQAYTGPAGSQTIQSMVYAAAATDRDFSNGLTGRRVTAAEIMDACTSTNKQVTQAVLQVKHSASQAADMEHVMQRYLSMAAAGCKLERSEDAKGNPVWTRARGADGKFEQATPEEYVAQMTDVYENGMGVSVVPEKLHIMADYLTDASTGKIKTPAERRKEAPPLQRMAYDGAGDNGFATLQAMAHEGRNLYEGSPNLNNAMIPRQIRDNMRIQADREAGVEDTPMMTPLVETKLLPTHSETMAKETVGVVHEQVSEPETESEAENDALFDVTAEAKAAEAPAVPVKTEYRAASVQEEEAAEDDAEMDF